ncbi:MAG: Gfo/Idh/MocA family oxidoreductase, partial [Chloroflexota bacterium]|nr:Gfo/Idh/MocA family oxidoreductase [Chloroflexota bacterium]
MTRLGFAGVGHLGQALLQAATALGPDFQPVAIQDPWPASLDAAAALAPDLQRYADYEAMLDEAALDAVVISTPTFLHLPQATAALQRGLPTLLQKPIALNGAEADQILAVAAQHQGRLLVDYSYRYTASAAAMRAAIAAGALGRPLAVEARFH